MKRFLGPVFVLVVLAMLQGCMTGSDSGRTADGLDTSEVFSNGERKPRMPTVSYRTHDSQVHIRIYGTGGGDENDYWIYRNDSLLEQPVPYGWVDTDDDSVSYYLYNLVDRLDTAGLYKYHVRYGYNERRLSRPSPDFFYAYPGRSPSGSVSLEKGGDQRVTVSLAQADSTPISQAYFERKFGSDGEVTVLDTVLKVGLSPIRLLDTHFVRLDTMVYYRAVSMDAATETWLAPTSWDSIHVTNRTWTMVPGVDYSNLGIELRAEIRVPLAYSGQGWYFLYRNATPDKEGKIKVDSVAMQGNFTKTLRDTVSRAATYYYWVEALDPYGRTSLRSVPTPIAFTGIPRGPDVLSLTVHSSHIQIRAPRDAAATAYVLFRSPEKGGPETVVDTLYSADLGGEAPTFVDVPPGDGLWSYRMVVFRGGNPSAPGNWNLSDYFRYAPSYAFLPVSIVNKGGSGVEAAIEPKDDARYVLFRSRNPDGSDSVAVDSLAETDTRVVLKDRPPLGTWYYRVVRFDKPSAFNHSIYRTDLVRIDYTGNRVGPEIKTVTNYTGGIEVVFAYSPDAVAYVVERSPDTAEAWTTVDTLPVVAGQAPTHIDHPPQDGHWSFRARTLLADLSLTHPGPVMRTRTAWIRRVTYDNSLYANIANRGSQVECVLTTVSSYGYYLKRSLQGDYADPVTVDSVQAGGSTSILLDVPAKGTYYYWLERMPESDQLSGSILRSLPFKVDFTGAPEVQSLTQTARGILIRYATLRLGDTLEIWKSSGTATDSASFTLRATATAVLSPSSFEDITVDAGKAQLYHYRLALRSEGKTTGKGPVKTLYYQP